MELCLRCGKAQQWISSISLLAEMGQKDPMTWDNRESVRKAIRRSDLLRWDTPIFRKSQVSLGFL